MFKGSLQSRSDRKELPHVYLQQPANTSVGESSVNLTDVSSLHTESKPLESSLENPCTCCGTNEDFKTPTISWLYEVSLNRKTPATSVQSLSPQTCRPGRTEEHPSGNKPHQFLSEGCGLVYFCKKQY